MARKKAFDEHVILEKALEYFWAHGFHATKMDELIKYLGISRGSLYATFGKDKASLFSMALDHYIQKSQNWIESTLSKYDSVKEAFRAILKQALEEAKAEPVKKGCFVVNTSTELAAHDPDIQKKVQDNSYAFQKIFQLFIIKGQAQGEIPQSHDAKALAMSLFTFLQGLRVLSKVHHQDLDLQAIIEPVMSMLD